MGDGYVADFGGVRYGISGSFLICLRDVLGKESKICTENKPAVHPILISSK